MHEKSAFIAAAVAAALTVASAASLPARAAGLPKLQLEPSVPWLSAGNGASDDHYAASEIILGKYALPFLFPRWIFSADGEVQGTPTVDGNAVYFSDTGGTIWRVDAQTGKALWKASLPSITGDSSSYSRVSPAIGANTIIVGDQASGTILALSQSSGKLVWRTVVSNDPAAFITASPIVLGGRVYVGVSSNSENLAATQPGFAPTFRGSVAALNLSDGSIAWQTTTVPPGYTGGPVWSSNMSVDPARQAIYATTGNNYSVPPAVQACQKAAGTSTVAQAACLPTDDHIDSILSLNMNTGAINWADRFTPEDTWTDSCLPQYQPAASPCPSTTSLDEDFGSGTNLFSARVKGVQIDLVGAGQKSGAYYAINRDTGQVVWGTQVSPDGNRGGIEWGTAYDGQRIYVPNANSFHVPTTLLNGKTTTGGYWAALDPSTGRILWETPTTAPAPLPASKDGLPVPPGALAEAEGSVSVANAVMYGEDSAGNFVALDTATGAMLRSFESGGAAIDAPAIVDGTLYWTSGYNQIGADNNKVYAFWVGLQ